MTKKNINDTIVKDNMKIYMVHVTLLTMEDEIVEETVARMTDGELEIYEILNAIIENFNVKKFYRFEIEGA